MTSVGGCTPTPTGPSDADRIRRRRTRIALAVVIGVFVLLSGTVALATPAYESADETSHVQNIETLVSGHWYGMQSDCHRAGHVFVHCTGLEAGQPPLYYLVMAGWQDLVGVSYHPPYLGATTHAWLPIEFFVHHTSADHRFLLWLRLPNIALGALTVLVTFVIARDLARDAVTPIAAAAVVATLPRFVFLSAFVTNDNLVILLGALLLLAGLRFARRPTAWRMVAVGAVFGLIVTTKISALPLAVVLVVLPLLVAGWRRRLGLFAVGAGSTLVVSSWYLIQNTVRYGDPLARVATTNYLIHTGGLGTGIHPYVVYHPWHLVFVDVPRVVEQTFWYQSGWNQFVWPPRVGALFWVVLAASLVGLIGRRTDRRDLAVLVTVALAGLACIWVIAFQTSTYTVRYAFVGLPAIACLAALGTDRWPAALRFVLPVMGIVGCVVAIDQNILAVHWT